MSRLPRGSPEGPVYGLSVVHRGLLSRVERTPSRFLTAPGDRRTHDGQMSEEQDTEGSVRTPPVHEQVGLALRADRRRRGQSQRDYAKERSLSRDTLARAEVDASAMRLESIVRLLAGTGFELSVRPVSDNRHPGWDVTDLEARTRAGARFPAHRVVKESRWGPRWWEYHELYGNRGLGPRPRWTAEGFVPPPGTRYGKEPTPGPDGGPRWPWNAPDLPD